MKTRLFATLLSFSFLFIIGCSASDDNIEMESAEQATLQDVVLKMESSNLYDYIMKSRNTKGTTNKNNGNEGASPYWSAEYSNFHTEQGEIVGTGFIPGTSLLMVWDYPINGEDRIHVNGEYGHMTWNIHQPKVYIVDLSTGLVEYSNWCEENRTGFFKENLSGRVYEEDRSGNGETDVWQIRVNDPESNGVIHIKTTLTDGQNNSSFVLPVQGDCTEATSETNLDLKIWINNGIISAALRFNGVHYPRTQIN